VFAYNKVDFPDFKNISENIIYVVQYSSDSIIDEFERKINEFDNLYKRYSNGEQSLKNRWQLAASEAVNIHKQIAAILNDDDSFSDTQLDRISNLIMKFKSSFAIDELLARYETFLDGFDRTVNRFILNKSNNNRDQVINVMQQSKSAINGIRDIIESIDTYPFSIDQYNKFDSLLLRQSALLKKAGAAL
jgi:transcription initiation factor IIF auxiliary subunit